MVKEGNDQEMDNQRESPTPQTDGVGKKNKMTFRYLCQENIP